MLNSIDNLDINYLKKFLVGLLDGDGSIQISLIDDKYFQFTFRIELKYTRANELLLNLFCSKLNIGRCFYYKRDEDANLTIMWSESSKDGIIKIFEILKEYPPLTKIRRDQFIRAQYFF